MALAVAVLWHAALLGAVVLHGRLVPAQQTKPRQEVAMRPISAEDWMRNRGVAPTSDESSRRPTARRQDPSEEKKAAEKKDDSLTPPGPVVAVPPGNNQVPDDAQKTFAAESNNKVEEQTIARDRSTKWKNAQRRTTASENRTGAGSDEAQAAQIGGNGGKADADRPETEGGKRSRKLEVPDISPRQEIAMRPTPKAPGDAGPKVKNQRESEAVRGNSDRLDIQDGEDGSGDNALPSEGRRGAQGIASLLPSSAVMDQITGAAPSDLKDDDLPEGDGTFLNTREWKFAGFFNRVKQGVSWNWDPGPQMMRRDPTGTMYGGRDRVTVLSVTLDREGNLEDVVVQRSSGLDFLDVEAVKAFEKAQPFPHPPSAMMRDGKIAFQFSFYLDMGGAPRFRLTLPR